MKKSQLCAAVVCYALVAVGCAGAESQSDDTADPTASQATESADEASDVGVATQELSAYDGCKGTGLSVCNELVDPDYYVAHPSCQRNPTCRLPYWACDAACPAPTSTEKPNAKIVAGGTSTPAANVQVMYIKNGTRHASELFGYEIPESYAWERLQRGVGVYGSYFTDVEAYCDVGHLGITRKISSMTVRWNDGRRETMSCQDANACAGRFKVRFGFTATCNYATR